MRRLVLPTLVASPFVGIAIALLIAVGPDLDRSLSFSHPLAPHTIWDVAAFFGLSIIIFPAILFVGLPVAALSKRLSDQLEVRMLVVVVVGALVGVLGTLLTFQTTDRLFVMIGAVSALITSTISAIFNLHYLRAVEKESKHG
jgi:hypothetical protein